MTKSEHSAKSEQAAQLITKAESCVNQYDWSSADYFYREAITFDETPASRIAYGVSLASREKFFAAITVFSPILDCDNRHAISIVCHNLAAIYRTVGDFDLARRFQWRSTLLQDHVGPEDLLGMANDSLMSDQIEAAESMVMLAHQLQEDSEEAKCPTDEATDADLLAMTGVIEARQRSVESGLVIVFAAYRRHQATGDLVGMGSDLLNLALFFGDVHRYRAQRSCVNRAIRCFERAGATFSQQKARKELHRLDQMQAVRMFDSTRN